MKGSHHRQCRCSARGQASATVPSSPVCGPHAPRPLTTAVPGPGGARPTSPLAQRRAEPGTSPATPPPSPDPSPDPQGPPRYNGARASQWGARTGSAPKSAQPMGRPGGSPTAPPRPETRLPRPCAVTGEPMPARRPLAAARSLEGTAPSWQRRLAQTPAHPRRPHLRPAAGARCSESSPTPPRLTRDLAEGCGFPHPAKSAFAWLHPPAPGPALPACACARLWLRYPAS